MKSGKLEKAILFGPFIGELSWEMFRFAPYMIYLKKQKRCKTLVFTRRDRFDLYGLYADILVPLKIDELYTQNCFRANELPYYESEFLAKLFEKKYYDRFNIEDHYTPCVSGFRYKVKWQFPRMYMEYDFKPRTENKTIVNEILNGNPCVFVDLSVFNEYKRDEVLKQISTPNLLQQIIVYDPTTKDDLSTDIKNVNGLKFDNKTTTLFGCIAALIPECIMTIGNLESSYSHLSLLMNVPLASLFERKTEDDIRLLNPLNTKIYTLQSDKGTIGDVITNTILNGET